MNTPIAGPRTRPFGLRRILPVLLLAAPVLAFISFMTVWIPVHDAPLRPRLTRGELMLHWPIAVAAVAIVVAVDAVVIAAVLRQRGRERRRAEMGGSSHAKGGRRP